MSTETTPAETPLVDNRALIALRTALALIAPLARWLVRNGVPYTSFAPALKPVFVEAARRELEAVGAKVTDSSLSVLSGVHRRDIRAFGRDEGPGVAPKTPSVASQVFTRWLADAAYRDAENQPMALPKAGAGPSFDSLARQVSSDVHPRTLLAEMQRMELIVLEGDRVRLRAHAFLPQQGFDEKAAMFSDNVADHIAAAAHNLGGQPGRFLEQSVFGSGLSQPSIDVLGDTARRLWAEAFEQMVREATGRFEQDRARTDTPMRMRFGVYFYAEPDDSNVAATGQEPAAHSLANPRDR